MKYGFFILIFFLCNCSQSQIDIFEERQLFLDDYIVESIHNLDFKLHSPTELINDNLPLGYYQTLVKKDSGRYLLYYRSYFKNYKGKRFDGNVGEVTKLKFSDDGVTWKNNILNNDVDSLQNVVLYQPPFNHNFTPFLDKNPNVVKSEKYKAVSGINKINGLWLFYSDNGFDWNKRSTPLISSNCKACFDSQNILFWSEIEKRYVMYYRTWNDGKRGFSKRTSNDLIKWSEEESQNVNEEGEHLYTSGLFPYFREENIYIGFATRFFPKNGNTTDIVLLSSRHGNGVQRMFKEAIIRPGLNKSNWGNRSNYITLNGIIPLNENEMMLLARGKNYKIRTDGFISISSKYKKGFMITKPFILKSKKIEINYATAAGGFVQIELLDKNNKKIKVLNEKETISKLVGDKTNELFNLNVSDIYLNKEVKLKVNLKEADFFSFKFIN